MNRPGRVAQPLFARSFGTGPRDVLALHCTMAHSGAWRGLAEAMAGEVTIHATDMLNHGKSPDWDGQGDFQQAVLEGVAAHLDRRMDVVGHSFGATVALRLAVAYPERIRSLTLIEPVYFAVARQDAPQLVADHDADARDYIAALAARNDALGARLFNRMWSDGGPRWPDLPESKRAAMIRGIHVIPFCNPALYDDRPGMLKPGVLARVTAPAVLLRGSRTHPVIAAINEGLARRLPDARSHVIDGAGHMVPITHPEATAAHLRALFARAPL